MIVLTRWTDDLSHFQPDDRSFVTTLQATPKHVIVRKSCHRGVRTSRRCAVWRVSCAMTGFPYYRIRVNRHRIANISTETSKCVISIPVQCDLKLIKQEFKSMFSKKYENWRLFNTLTTRYIVDQNFPFTRGTFVKPRKMSLFTLRP